VEAEADEIAVIRGLTPAPHADHSTHVPPALPHVYSPADAEAGEAAQLVAEAEDERLDAAVEAEGAAEHSRMDDELVSQRLQQAAYEVEYQAEDAARREVRASAEQLETDAAVAAAAGCNCVIA